MIRRLGRLLDDLDADDAEEDDLVELRRLLYGLHAILRLHTAQEDEGYLSLAEESEAAHDHPLSSLAEDSPVTGVPDKRP